MTLRFKEVKLSAYGKTGIIKPDEDGYYELVLGGLNTYNNSASWYYTSNGIDELFGPGSLFQRRIRNGCLRAEVNHPKKQAGESVKDFTDRYMDIDMNNVCAHFKEIWLDKEFGKKHPELKNPSLIAIMGKVKPIPPKGDILNEALTNKAQNICFSIRSIADEFMSNGRVERDLKTIVTIDLVNEGGIVFASKWDSPATESSDNIVITKEHLTSIVKNEKVFALESSKIIAKDVLDKCFKEPPSKPSYYNW